MGPFDTAAVGLRARKCTCQEFQIRNLLAIDVAGKQVADYIPHHHTLDCKISPAHEVRPKVALAIDNCHPPAGRFAAAIGKLKREVMTQSPL